MWRYISSGLLFFTIVTSAEIYDGTSQVYRAARINFTDIANKVRLNTNLDISPECREQIVWLTTKPSALFQMADAWSKFPYTGAFYYASKTDTGNYDECVKVNAKSIHGDIIGKYCLWGWELPDLRPNQTTSNYSLSYCVPEKCTAADLNKVIGQTYFNEKYCSTKNTDSELDTGAIIVISVSFLVDELSNLPPTEQTCALPGTSASYRLLFSCFLFVILFSTAYDVYLFYEDKKSLHPLCTSFSVFTNGKKLFQTTRSSHGSEEVLCFHGMKFISMWWIISGNGTKSWGLAPTINYENIETFQYQRYTQYLTTAHISVDTFFFISGFLMAYLYFKQEISKKPIVQQIKMIPSRILHRYLRITPAAAMCFLGSVYILKYLDSGPFFSNGIRIGIEEPCKKYWWTYFLYIQNYYNFHYGEPLCIPTTWYLSVDMQLFIATPIIIIPLTIIYKRSLRNTMIVMLLLNLMFFAISIFVRLQWRDYDPYFFDYDSHSKLISYFTGIMVGVYVRHEKHKKLVIGRKLNFGLWFVSLGIMLAVMLYRGEIQMKNEYVSTSLYYCFTRPLWCLALSWVTYSCVKGHGGIINWFLSSSFMQIGGKLTYCIYIIHSMVIVHYALAIKNRVQFTDWNIFYRNCGYFIMSVVVGTIWYLAFESPMTTIERFIFGTGKIKAQKTEQKRASNESPKDA